MWDEDLKKHEDAFKLMHDVITWSNEAGLRVIVDLHILRSHHFNHGEKPLWTERAAQETFFELWTELSGELNDYSNGQVAYELMNEAVAPEHDDWNKLINRGIAEIRKNEPNRVIVVGANMWQIAPNLQYLKLPKEDKNIILSFHTYSPMLFTHYTANWTPLENYVGDVNYPGPIISEEEYNANVDSTDEGTFQFYQEARENWGPDRILEGFKMGIDFADSLNLQLFCGEFGCMPTVPRKARLQYYSDLITVLEQNEVAWCNWEYKGDFGIYFWDSENIKSGEADTEFIDILLQFKQE
jgi:endoglucanase